MLGLLVHLGPDRLDREDFGGLVPERSRQRTVYIGTVRGETVRIVAYADGSDRYVRCDHDLTPVLVRIGCSGPEQFARWAASPVALSATDNDLLRYRLGLPLVPATAPVPLLLRPPATPGHQTGFEHDVAAMQLLAAVYEDPASDEPRLVLADRLQELGDPRGEMMGLQLGRARTGAHASERERELLSQHGRMWTRPLASMLGAYGFRRGFLASAAIDERVMYAPDLLLHRSWVTIETLETTNSSIVTAPHLRSLRRLATDDVMLASLAGRSFPTIETIVGTSVLGPRGVVVQGGIRVPRQGTSTAALPRLRAISLDGSPEDVARFVRSSLGRRLEHVELFVRDLDALVPETWRMLAELALPALGVRGFVGPDRVVIACQHGRLYVQLAGPEHPDPRPITAIARMLGGDAPLVVECVQRENSVSHETLAQQLARSFSDVSTGIAQHWRSP